jgi:hypothetical protein
MAGMRPPKPAPIPGAAMRKGPPMAQPSRQSPKPAPATGGRDKRK